MGGDGDGMKRVKMDGTNRLDGDGLVTFQSAASPVGQQLNWLPISTPVGFARARYAQDTLQVQYPRQVQQSQQPQQAQQLQLAEHPQYPQYPQQPLQHQSENQRTIPPLRPTSEEPALRNNNNGEARDKSRGKQTQTQKPATAPKKKSAVRKTTVVTRGAPARSSPYMTRSRKRAQSAQAGEADGDAVPASTFTSTSGV